MAEQNDVQMVTENGRKPMWWIWRGLVAVLVIALLVGGISACSALKGDAATETAEATKEVVYIVATPTPQAEPELDGGTLPPRNYVPTKWFGDNGFDYYSGKVVAYDCEVGARAWQGTFGQGPIKVPNYAIIELYEVNCVQYAPGDTIPASELAAVNGLGTIWFRVPIQGTENMKGDCPCPNGQCDTP